MKKLLIITIAFISFNLSAQQQINNQEVVTYEQLDDNLIKVTKYNGTLIKEIGYVTKVGDRLLNTGVWRQYDNDGNISLKVKYENGLRKETVAYQDNRVIKVYRKN